MRSRGFEWRAVCPGGGSGGGDGGTLHGTDEPVYPMHLYPMDRGPPSSSFRYVHQVLYLVLRGIKRALGENSTHTHADGGEGAVFAPHGALNGNDPYVNLANSRTLVPAVLQREPLVVRSCQQCFSVSH